MKKLITMFLIIASLAAVLFGCVGTQVETTDTEKETEQITTEEVTTVEETTSEIIKAPDEDDSLLVWYDHSFTKTDPENRLTRV